MDTKELTKMIFYFTGTGNSGYIASEIGKKNNEKIIDISDVIHENKDLEFTLQDGEVIGFVYPVYAWAPPKMVMEFIRKVKLKNYKDHYIFSVASCGENIGNTMDVVKKALLSKGMVLNSGFSITMPNNYIIMGDIDSKEEEKNKLQKAENQIKEINQIIKARKNDQFSLEKGFAPGILTTIINPLFTKFAINTSKFHVMDNCVSCGKCEKVCNAGTITMVDGLPVWKGECSQCLACVHYCPKKAIQYGNSTVKKGRYTHPNFRP